ncbi:unnamed protein product [Sphenostylis stenocarpa]|uniref:Uncharacterized protein n=1 Tax=Sphenostylis stenocarpa TaxID=92480 RepID=A0AA86SMN4_9FABA|nr:unnamed protein product [Sphenostylis stenocarpa]
MGGAGEGFGFPKPQQEEEEERQKIKDKRWVRSPINRQSPPRAKRFHPKEQIRE